MLNVDKVITFFFLFFWRKQQVLLSKCSLQVLWENDDGKNALSLRLQGIQSLYLWNPYECRYISAMFNLLLFSLWNINDPFLFVIN